jgi:hypothetical protein
MYSWLSCRHCLWILGNGLTLTNSNSDWKDLVLDAKNRGCFFNASDDASLGETIKNAVKDLVKPRRRLNQDDLLVYNCLSLMFSLQNLIQVLQPWKCVQCTAIINFNPASI